MRHVRVLLVVGAVVGLTSCAWMARSSVSSNPAAVQGDGASGRPSLSQGGRFVAFESAATNLVPGDTNGVRDVFVRDHVTGATERVSVATGGAQGTGASGAPSISDDGRFVAFETDAANLVPGDGDDDTDVVVRDRQVGTTTLVSTDVAVPPVITPGEFDATRAAINGDGTVVAFTIGVPFQGSCCAPLGPYVRDLAAGTTTVMPSVGGFAFGLPSLSDDGSRIAYGQFGPPDQIGDAPYGVVVADTAGAGVVANIAGGILSHQAESRFDVAIAGDGATAMFLFVNFSIGTLHRVDLAQPQVVPVLDGLAGPHSLRVSDDASVVAMVIGADYVVTDAAGAPPRIVSADPQGAAATTPEGIAGDLSGDGRFVAFASSDPDLLAGDTNGVSDVFLRNSTFSTAGPT
jgi:Tol biopolymer transport system component